jgi:hypothetical protein
MACVEAERQSGELQPSQEGGALRQTANEVVYGTDDRRDVYAHPDATLRTRAQQSTVALMRSGAVDATNPSNVTFRSLTLQEARNLCPTERFLEDPTAASCSGTLIDDDLVLTAGHCITSRECPGTRIVFNYYRPTADALRTVTTEDVFSCAAVVAREQRQELDYAVVRLDRPAAPRFTPAPMRAGSSALADGQPVAVIGTGSGVPFKIDSGGTVRDPRTGTGYFVANTDTFGGNSGSGVYETGGYTVAGILVRGEVDYVSNGSCNVVNVCAETGCRGEDIIYASSAIDSFCRTTSNANARLCGSRTSDFNKDGSLDVLWQHRTDNKSAVWFLDRGSFVSEEVTQGPADVNWSPVTTGDFDGDGNLDILRHHRTRGQLAFWFMEGGTLRSEVVIPGIPDVNWQPVAAADFDGDGQLDVLWHHLTRGRAAIWFMRKTVPLSKVTLTGFADVNWKPVTTGDFDGDGTVDILWHHRTQGQLALWFLQGRTRYASLVLEGLPDVNWRPVAAGDFNGDGSLDILWHHRTLGQLSLWFMRADTLLSSVVLPGLPDLNWYVVR